MTTLLTRLPPTLPRPAHYPCEPMTRGEVRRLVVLTTLAVVFLIVGLIYGYGCATRPRPNAPDATPHIGHAQDAVKDIGPRTETIDKHTTDIERKVPAKVAIVVGPHTSGIRAESAVIRRDAEVATVGLTSAQGETDALKKDNAGLLKDRDKWKAESQSSLRKLVAGTILLCVVGLGISAAAFFGGYTRWGKAGAAGCLVTLIAAVIVGWYSFWIGIVLGGALTVIGIGWVVNRVRVERKLTIQTAGLHEVAKQVMDDEQRLMVYGDSAVRGQADIIEDVETRRIIKAVRGKSNTLGKVRPAKEPPPVVTLAVPTIPTATTETVTTTKTATKRKGRL